MNEDQRVQRVDTPDITTIVTRIWKALIPHPQQRARLDRKQQTTSMDVVMDQFQDADVDTMEEVTIWEGMESLNVSRYRASSLHN